MLLTGVNVGELECILPDELKNGALASEHELVLPYADALAAIAIATNHQIAILGVDAFEVRRDGLRTIHLGDASRHIHFTGDWRAYVENLNAGAEHWLKDHRLGENNGYILTSASESELAAAKARIDNS